MRPLLRMCIQYFHQGIVYRSLLLMLLYASKVMQASTHNINKLSPLNIYLDFEATMTTHKLVKKRSYRQSCLISDWLGLRLFCEIINALQQFYKILQSLIFLLTLFVNIWILCVYPWILCLYQRISKT